MATKTTIGWLAALAVTGTLAAGCGADGDTGTAAPAPAATTSAARPAEPPPSPSVPPAASPSRSAPESPVKRPAKRPAKPDRLRHGDKGPEVVALQKRLTELGYWNGKADGRFGSSTQQAVYALQKTAGLNRDGVAGPRTRKAVERGVRPKARSTKGHVVEISLKRQLLMIVDDGRITRIFNTSTGSNDNYEHDGETYLADTPPGRFRVSRQIDGWRDAPLGLLWRPKYFNGGIAVHGAHNVPPYPASHGCARLSIAAMNWIWANDAMPVKTRVWVY
ncbi:L,D-transpeptidase family protein [Jidongwangia harbinensis]|uniref:L,D-transpeptidase family protein n=1 Tax=Jidongwangia harbinensis TaxID=2878561 RepID=UPI001CDA020A|nr:L,D-transpeptidase family protein [Jidongwangia harbinensis]MCA2218098.1 L,D-transpeptidase family protein [Jidongwangia harbinensis]